MWAYNFTLFVFALQNNYPDKKVKNRVLLKELRQHFLVLTKENNNLAALESSLKYKLMNCKRVSISTCTPVK